MMYSIDRYYDHYVIKQDDKEIRAETCCEEKIKKGNNL